MLIYTNSNISSPFGSSAGYKSASNPKRRSIPSKDTKRVTQQRRSPHKTKKKNKKKNLNAKNVKFLKSLGYTVKKQ